MTVARHKNLPWIGFVALCLGLMLSQARAAKYSGEFLSLGVGASALGQGGAYTAIAQGPWALYWNPAGLADSPKKEFAFMHAETFGSLLNQDYLGAVLPVRAGRASIGFALYYLGGGGIALTDLDYSRPHSGNPYGYVFQQVGTASHGDYVFYSGYGQKLTDKLRWGGSVKLIYRKIVDESAFGLGVDGGLLYDANQWLVIGVKVSDVTSTFLAYSTGTTESIYPGVNLGLNARRSIGRFTLSPSADFRILFEGRERAADVHVGPVSSDIHVGGEIVYADVIKARIGSYSGDLTVGAGLLLKKFAVDFALLDHQELDNSYRVSLSFRL